MNYQKHRLLLVRLQGEASLPVGFGVPLPAVVEQEQLQDMVACPGSCVWCLSLLCWFGCVKHSDLSISELGPARCHESRRGVFKEIKAPNFSNPLLFTGGFVQAAELKTRWFWD